MSEVVVTVTQGDIDSGVRGEFNTHPLLSALVRAFGAASCSLAEGDDGAYSVEVAGRTVALPRRAQYFLRVWEYGPAGGFAYPVRGRDGDVVARRTFAEVVRPFSFVLTDGDSHG